MDQLIKYCMVAHWVDRLMGGSVDKVLHGCSLGGPSYVWTS